MEQLANLIACYFKQLLKLIKRDWPYFLLIIIIFAVGVLFGEYLREIAPQYAKIFEKMANEKFTGMADRLKNAPFYIWILAIFFNNLLVSLMMVVVGFIFPLLSLFFLVGNGIVIGVFQHVAAKMGLSAATYYLALVPHGIFELSAVFIAAGLGIRFGMIPYRLFWCYLKSDEPKPLFQNYFRELPYYAILIIILLCIAAMVEITISPALLK